MEEQLLLCRTQTAAEREALGVGFEVLGVRDLLPAAADASPWC
jgi:hypothetical protein